MVLLCVGDIETNPGPRDTLGLNYSLGLLEDVVMLMRETFDGGERQSYPSKAGTLADELNKTLEDLRTNVIELRYGNHKQLEGKFVDHVAENFEVLDLFYKLYRHVFLGKPFIVRFAVLRLSFCILLIHVGKAKLEDFLSWAVSCFHILCVVAHWTVRGSTICEKLASSGLLYSNIYFIQKQNYFPVKDTEEVSH